MIRELTSDTTTRTNADRMLGTVLFTDLVKSTELLTRIGDAAYRDLRAAHERQVRLTVENSGGRLVNVIGDGTLSIFDRASDAVRCAEAICAESDAQHIAVRAGVHTGELERTGMDITGMTVHVGARVAALAGAGEVLVSRTVKDLLLGSGIQFRDRGSKALKGVPGKWDLYALAGHQPTVVVGADDKLLATPADRMAAYRTTCPASGPWRGRGGQRLATKTRGSSLSGEVRLTEPDVLLHRCIAGRAVTSGE